MTATHKHILTPSQLALLNDIKFCEIYANEHSNGHGISKNIVSSCLRWHNRTRLSQCQNLIDWLSVEPNTIVLQSTGQFLVDDRATYTEVYANAYNPSEKYAELPFMARVNIDVILANTNYKLVDKQGLDAAIHQYNYSLIDTKPEVISLDWYNDQFEVLPPQRLTLSNGVELFHLSELYSGDIAIWYAHDRVNHKCYKFKHTKFADVAELLKVVNNG